MRRPVHSLVNIFVILCLLGAAVLPFSLVAAQDQPQALSFSVTITEDQINTLIQDVAARFNIDVARIFVDLVPGGFELRIKDVQIIVLVTVIFPFTLVETEDGWRFRMEAPRIEPQTLTDTISMTANEGKIPRRLTRFAKAVRKAILKAYKQIDQTARLGVEISDIVITDDDITFTFTIS